MKKMISTVTPAVLILFCVVGAVAGGTITGTVRLIGTRDASNIVVYIEKVEGKTPTGVSFTPPAKHPIMDQLNLTFVPHVLPVVAGATVNFPNSDVVRHNVFSPSKTKRFNLGTYPAGVIKSVTFDQPGKVALLCNVHAEMSAFIIVLENPYFAVTDKDGKYRIENVPPGKYKLVTWHEKLKPQTQEIEVGSSTEVVANFQLKE